MCKSHLYWAPSTVAPNRPLLERSLPDSLLRNCSPGSWMALSGRKKKRGDPCWCLFAILQVDSTRLFLAGLKSNEPTATSIDFTRSRRGGKCAAPSSGLRSSRHFDVSATLGFNWPAIRVRHPIHYFTPGSQSLNHRWKERSINNLSNFIVTQAISKSAANKGRFSRNCAPKRRAVSSC